MNHKPKKEKLPYLGETTYVFDKVNYHQGLGIVLGRNKFYGVVSKSPEQEKSRKSGRRKDSDSSDDEVETVWTKPQQMENQMMARWSLRGEHYDFSKLMALQESLVPDHTFTLKKENDNAAI
jgi:hypothetical protein